jgi:hypothetical protein
MRVITTRDLTKLQAVPIEDIIEKFDSGTPLLFVDQKIGTMKLFRIKKTAKCEESITLSNLRASPRKLLSKFVVACVNHSITGSYSPWSCLLMHNP